MGMRDQLHVQAVLAQGNCPRRPLNKELGVPQRQSKSFGGGNNYVRCKIRKYVH
jgi:hypothetical protein